jgi:hypothetical protein
MKKLIISESEKKRIFEMYNLITENVDQELVDYGNNYIDSHSCDEIYNDLLKFQSAVNSGQVQMSDEDKKELDDNLGQMKTYKSLFCGKIKKEMKKSFAEQAQSNPEKLKDSMCWFASNISQPQTPLKACQATTTTPVQTGSQTPTQTQTTTNTQQPTQTTNTQTTTNTQQPTQTTNTQTTTNQNVNYELDTVEKIKDFQNWMDKNYGKWAYSNKYKRNYSVDRNSKKGWGSMGPNTTKAWNDQTKKEKYLKEKGLLVSQNNTQQPVTSKTTEIKKNYEPATDDEVSQF